MTSSFADTPQRLAELCHRASFGQAGWEEVLAELVRWLDADKAMLLMKNEGGRYAYSLSLNHNPDSLEAYNRHYNRLDPRAEDSLQTPVGQARLGQHFTSNDSIRHTEYFHEISLKGDVADSVHGILADNAETGRQTISIQRGFAKPYFDTEQAEKLQAVLPTLALALRNSLRTAWLLGEAQPGELVHYALVDRGLNLQSLELSLASQDQRRWGDLELIDGRLACSNGGFRRALERAVDAALKKRETRLRRSGLAIAVSPLPPALSWAAMGGELAFLAINRETAAVEGASVFAESFGLTAREAEVLVALCESGTAREAAIRLGLSHETVRWHAKNICSKTGHGGARELVAAARANDLSNLE